jgi:hypothetical protein
MPSSRLSNPKIFLKNSLCPEKNKLPPVAFLKHNSVQLLCLKYHQAAKTENTIILF